MLFASVELVVLSSVLLLESLSDGVTDEDVVVSDGDHERDEGGGLGVHGDDFLKQLNHSNCRGKKTYSAEKVQNGAEAKGVKTSGAHLGGNEVVDEGLGDHVVDGSLVGLPLLGNSFGTHTGVVGLAGVLVSGDVDDFGSTEEKVSFEELTSFPLFP